jgi:hypothetical protein
VPVIVHDPREVHFHGTSEGTEKDNMITPVQPLITQMITRQNLNIPDDNRWQERYDLNLC